MQDNLSEIGVINNGGSFNRSKHLITRRGFVNHHVEIRDVIFEHCPGEVMPADMLTTPLDGSRLSRLMNPVDL